MKALSLAGASSANCSRPCASSIPVTNKPSLVGGPSAPALSRAVAFRSLFIFLIKPSQPPSGTPSRSLSVLNLSLTISVCQRVDLRAQPPMPSSFSLALLPPIKYSSRPPTFSIVLRTLACTLTSTNLPRHSDHSRFRCMLGYHRRRVLISFFDEILLPNWMCEPPYRPKLDCLYVGEGPYGYGGIESCLWLSCDHEERARKPSVVEKCRRRRGPTLDRCRGRRHRAGIVGPFLSGFARKGN